MQDSNPDAPGTPPPDSSGLENLVVESMPRLRAYLRVHMGAELRAHESIDDLAQSVSRELIEDIRQGFEYRGRGAFLRWLFTCALNKIRARHRYRHRECRTPKREQPSFDAEAAAYVLSPSRHAIGREELDRFNHAFGQLRSDEQEVILLNRFAGLDHTELAAELGVSPDAARMRLGRAMSRLATACDRGEPDGRRRTP